jgi:hypothetical protein
MVMIMVFNATLSNIPVISRRPAILEGGTGVQKENKEKHSCNTLTSFT